jgi:succinate dehydrogenase hydrophobic anchor subunit
MKIQLIKKPEPTKAQIERGVGLLNSLKIVINVLYALLVFQIFLILPRPDDPELKYHTLNQIYSENIMQVLVIVVGIILVIMYWIQFNRQLGNLVRSSPIHASLSIVQMFFLMLYLYFVRFDMEFDGMKLALQMESIFLALTGFTGAFNWYYAKRNGLTSENIDENEELSVLYSLLPEPLASVFTLPFASFGPGVWTISFLIIIPIGYVLKLMRKRLETKQTNSKS